MRTNHVLIHKSSGFNYSINTSIVDTKRGAIRTIEIIDHEVDMTDIEPSSRFVLTFNENWPDTNTEQLKEFCTFVLKEIKQQKKKKNIKNK